MGSQRAVCQACPHGCALAEGQRGRCRARIARGGAVVSEAYGRVTGFALDPVEKKPFARFMPGAKVLSFGGYGCNMDCPWCQNASISNAGPDDVAWQQVTPQQVVGRAAALADQGCAGLAFTYNEPLICWEFVRDTAVLAHGAGLVNTLVTNGMCTPAVLKQLAPVIDAANVDLKCFTEEGYRAAGGSLAAVKETIRTLAVCETCHVEVTWLAVPGVSDSAPQLEEAAAWLASIDPGIPLHITRFFPCHRMAQASPTPVRHVYKLVRLARRHLSHVYPGNV